MHQTKKRIGQHRFQHPFISLAFVVAGLGLTAFGGNLYKAQVVKPAPVRLSTSVAAPVVSTSIEHAKPGGLLR